MSLSATLTPGYTFQTDGTDKITYSKLNQLGSPLVTISGTVGASEIEDGSITTAKIAPDAINSAKIANGAITLDHLLTADQGTILHRGASGWLLLAPGTNGQVLTSKGASDDVEWATVPTVSSVAASNITPGTANTVLITNNSGSTQWGATIPLSNITPGTANTKLTTNGSGTVEWASDVTNQYYTVWQSAAYNASGGTFTSATDVTRTLTDESDPGNIGSLSSNQITLEAGTYYVDAKVPANRVGFHVAWLYDTTGASTLIDGSAEYSDTANNDPTSSVIQGTFTLSGSSVLEIRHRCATSRSGDGLGLAHNISGHNSIYTKATFIKLG